jgi:hypothetical protein
MTSEEREIFERKGKSVRKQVEEEYDAILSEYAPGDYGIAELGEDDKRATVRNRLKAAAERRNLAVVFRRTRDNALRFQLVRPEDAAAGDEDLVEAQPRTGQRSQRRSVVA